MKKIIGASFAEMFEIRGTLSKRTRIIIFTSGIVGLFLIWWLVAEFSGINDYILPHPFSVAKGIVELLFSGQFLLHFLISLKLNLLGYLEAIAIGIPIGFLIGLFPFFDALLGWWLKAIRFTPLTAAVVIFMAAFGIATNMKVQFLTATILVFLIPAVARRVRDVNEVSVQKAKTLGFTRWQIIRTVFIPQGIAWAWDDIADLVAISWTYIVYVEWINQSQGGVGTFLYATYYRGHKTYLLWAILILLIVWGAIQDRLFRLISYWLWRWKHGKGA